jgi:hypothetical protein
MRLDSRVILDRLAISYDRDGTCSTIERRRPSVALVMDEEIMTRTTTLTYSAEGRHNHNTCVHPLSSAGPIGPAREGKGGAASGLPTPLFLSICFFFFFLSHPSTPVPSLEL